MAEIIVISILIILLLISIYYNVKFGIIILKTQDAIEECLDILDERYSTFIKILERPVFFDSIEVRQVIQEIKTAQDAILVIANKLSKSWETEKNEKDDNS
jgi:hypothetical protein